MFLGRSRLRFFFLWLWISQSSGVHLGLLAVLSLVGSLLFLLLRVYVSEWCGRVEQR
jgi:hypothetical protein